MRALFVVASHLGMPLSDLRQMPHREFVQWLAFLNLDNFPDTEPEDESKALFHEFSRGGVDVIQKDAPKDE